MADRASTAERPPSGGKPTRVRVWDLPTRLFHWGLAVLVAFSFATAQLGGNWMIWHTRSGYAVLALLVFRLIWGVVGSRHSRFRTFARGPREVVRYAAALVKGDPPRVLGHNPMGGWSVLAMLATLTLQAATGLFANDDIFIEGPLYGWVGKAASDRLTRIHRLNADVIVGLVALHLAAVLFYLLVKKENLIGPMLTGLKDWPEPTPPETDRRWLAPAIFLLSAAAVYFLVR